jgi:hypothetical protein
MVHQNNSDVEMELKIIFVFQLDILRCRLGWLSFMRC